MYERLFKEYPEIFEQFPGDVRVKSGFLSILASRHHSPAQQTFRMSSPMNSDGTQAESRRVTRKKSGFFTEERGPLRKTSSAKYSKKRNITSVREKNLSQNELTSHKNSLKGSSDLLDFKGDRNSRRDSKRESKRDAKRDSKRIPQKSERDSHRDHESRDSGGKEKEEVSTTPSHSLLSLASKQSLQRLTSRNRSSTVKRDRTGTVIHPDSSPLKDSQSNRFPRKRSLSKLRMEDSAEETEPRLTTNIDEYRKMV